MLIHREVFGTLPDGLEIESFRLSNTAGLEAVVMNYGASLTSLKTPDREGRLADIVLGFDTLRPYLREHPYLGATVGRYANRIAGGEFTLLGDRYSLARNNGPNHLHGGIRGFDKRVWRANVQSGPYGPQVQFRYFSADGEEGYPGNLEAGVAYTLTEDDALRIDFSATTNQPTLVNLTHHGYFNLAGEGTILDHVLRIAAARFLPVDATLIPTGEFRPVSCTPMDFTTPKAVGLDIGADDDQLRFANGGYDHNWVLDSRDDPETVVAEVYEPSSGRIFVPGHDAAGLAVLFGQFSGRQPAGQGRFGLPETRRLLPRAPAFSRLAPSAGVSLHGSAARRDLPAHRVLSIRNPRTGIASSEGANDAVHSREISWLRRVTGDKVGAGNLHVHQKRGAAMGRKVALLFDGTWANTRTRTNVTRLRESIQSTGENDPKQVCFYQPGVGNHWYDRLTGGVFGKGLSENIQAGYAWLIDNFREGDELFLFGYSRGGYTARSLVGLIRKCGLLRPEKRGLIDQAYELYRQRDETPDTPKSLEFRQKHSREIRIRFIGVWDTVGALGIPVSHVPFSSDYYRFHDTELSAIVDYAYHAVAVDENRQDYRVAVWTKRKPENIDVEQRWFIGSHGNVGGGNETTPPDLLPNLSLRWLQDRAEGVGLMFTSKIPVNGSEYLAPVTDSYAQFLMGLYRLASPRFSEPSVQGSRKRWMPAFGPAGRRSRIIGRKPWRAIRTSPSWADSRLYPTDLRGTPGRFRPGDGRQVAGE